MWVFPTRDLSPICGFFLCIRYFSYVGAFPLDMWIITLYVGFSYICGLSPICIVPGKTVFAHVQTFFSMLQFVSYMCFAPMCDFFSPTRVCSPLCEVLVSRQYTQNKRRRVLYDTSSDTSPDTNSFKSPQIVSVSGMSGMGSRSSDTAVCRGVPRCAEVCRGVPRCAVVCRGVPRCAEVCSGVWM